ncbi:TetR/AcrR family transcriptional regulator [Pelotomaculum propionicicum]|uniref:HTH-type transcriptional repressor KstR2 n=1 Tax=Pelotomaculum propionicicum TaxID=258475 RepID=A0A4Y7RLK7_9FIRM|nr:TetR/AcrR family transcriptional regulator [Pelotomaculum propionicicum]TEB09630.1 HTH-type transcriptional repressor KstR2 [Pelotomaculum propionicicum]
MDYRERIIKAYREQAASRGVSKVTMDDLVAATGISKRTIYRYFRSKEEIINAVLDDLIAGIALKIQAVFGSADKPLDKIINMLGELTRNIRVIEPQFLYDLQKYYPHLWEKIERFRSQRIQQVFEALLAGGEQNFLRQVHPKIFTTALLASIRSVVNPVFIVENQLILEEAIQSLFSIFLYGIVEAEHQQELKS